MSWGYELRVDLHNCTAWTTDSIGQWSLAVQTPAYIGDFAKCLVDEINMVAYGEPQVFHFGEGHLAGWTLMQFIETSNINAHFCDESGDAYINIFSCKEFDPNDALAMIINWFDPSSYVADWTERDAGKGLLCPKSFKLTPKSSTES